MKESVFKICFFILMILSAIFVWHRIWGSKPHSTIRPADFCETDADCPQLKCPDCGKIFCDSNRCVTVMYDKKCRNGEIKVGGACISCDTISAISITKENCSLCPNREYDEKNYLCVLKECPKEYPIRSVERCFSCDELKAIFVGSDKESFSSCQNRKFDRHNSVLKTCPKNTFRTPSGSCVYCTDDAPLIATEEECANCGEQRKMVYPEWFPSGLCEKNNNLNN